MRFTFLTIWLEAVGAILEEQGLIVHASLVTRNRASHVVLEFEDDTLYREMTQWAAAAFACGLIESPRIERM